MKNQCPIYGIIPRTYLSNIEKQAFDLFGENGLTPDESIEARLLFYNIVKNQHGHETELEEISRSIIYEIYSNILDGVKLDIKIVTPDDSEKKDTIKRILIDNTIETSNFKNAKIIFDEIKKRKIFNCITQGEAQNVHSMLYLRKNQLNKIIPDLVQDSLRLLELNEKIIWSKKRPSLKKCISKAPIMANTMEVVWIDCNTPVIKVRALQISMLLHETVKGIYELIFANAIPENAELAQTILAITDNLENEDEDIRYGKYIAADMRDYIYHFLNTYYPQINYPNIKEFIFGELSKIKTSCFLKFSELFFIRDYKQCDKLLIQHKIVDKIMKDTF